MPSLEAPDQFCEIPTRRLSFEISKFVLTGITGGSINPGANFETRDARVLGALLQWELENVAADMQITFKGSRSLLQNAILDSVGQSSAGNVSFSVRL